MQTKNLLFFSIFPPTKFDFFSSLNFFRFNRHNVLHTNVSLFNRVASRIAVLESDLISSLRKDQYCTLFTYFMMNNDMTTYLTVCMSGAENLVPEIDVGSINGTNEQPIFFMTTLNKYQVALLWATWHTTSWAAAPPAKWSAQLKYAAAQFCIFTRICLKKSLFRVAAAVKHFTGEIF